MNVLRLFLAGFFFVFFSANSFALILPDLHLDSKTYRQMLNMDGRKFEADELHPQIKMGERLYDWIEHINKFRNPELSLSSPESQSATPISEPMFNNRQLLLEKAKVFRASVPDWFRQVIFDNAAFTDTLPVPESEFVEWGRKADRLYALTARWLLQEPFLFSYELRKKDDVRGFYHLSHTPELEELLEDWSALTREQQTQLKTWLINLCENTTSTSTCQKATQLAINQNKAYDHYLKYLPRSQQVWNQYFRLSASRDDAEWTDVRPQEFRIPFVRPRSEAVEKFLVENIEDEYQWQGWHLILNFVTSGFDAPQIVFEAGATPHVDCLACNKITMDANVPITDYNVQWTIRHEFGHVLGFPDCYVEFYDRGLGKMVYYQLETDNLMCSRRGKFKQTHFDEMRRVYYR